MWRTSAYIDINAWKAGIVKRPEDYAWCSFAAAVKGDEKARRGYAFMYGNADDWDVIRDCHEKSMREAMIEILAAREDRAGGAGGERGACAGPQEESLGAEGGSRAGRAEAIRPGAGARQSGGRRADPGAPVRRSHEAGGASRGGWNQKPDSLQPVLPRADAGEGAHRPNRSRTSELAASGV